MGYYATLREYDIKDAVIKNVDEFEERRAKECLYGFEPENLQIIYGENGEIKDFDFQEYDTKWYDQEEFTNLLSEYLVEGSIQFWFEGEDMESWTWTAFPGVVIDGDWLQWEFDTLTIILEKSSASPDIKDKIYKEYLEYWEKMRDQAVDNIVRVKDLLEAKSKA